MAGVYGARCRFGISQIMTSKIKALKVLKTFFPYNDTTLNSKTLVPHQDGSVVTMSNS